MLNVLLLALIVVLLHTIHSVFTWATTQWKLLNKQFCNTHTQTLWFALYPNIFFSLKVVNHWQCVWICFSFSLSIFSGFVVYLWNKWWDNLSLWLIKYLSRHIIKQVRTLWMKIWRPSERMWPRVAHKENTPRIIALRLVFDFWRRSNLLGTRNSKKSRFHQLVSSIWS